MHPGGGLPEITTTLTAMRLDDLTGPEAFHTLRTMLTLRNLIEHHAATLLAPLIDSA